MAAYRFRVIIEDNEDVYRDIDIKAAQTFEELHNTILEAFKFDNKHAAAFFVSDDYWRKHLEITLRKEDLPLTPEEIRLKVEPKKLMSEAKIAKYIETPHQRFVYVYDENVQWNFLLEMMKITNEEPKAKYPLISKSIGNPPKQYKQLNIIKDEDPADALLAAIMGKGKKADKKEDDDVEDESEIYKSLKVEGVDAGDLEGLDGEEGEEAEVEEGEDDLEHGDDEESGDDFSVGDHDDDDR
ncbi:MAG: hypothetical protein KA163_13620 [Bacteroidia bacterium]|nr:hypothetical protein [Bacteroidia bacterium]